MKVLQRNHAGYHYLNKNLPHMPHFVIHCNEAVLSNHPAETIMSFVHDVADSTGLFRKGDIKVRIQTFSIYSVGNASSDFIHVFAWIMQGRSTEQKANLSKCIISKLKELFPDVPVVSMNVAEFEKATYCNRTMV